MKAVILNTASLLNPGDTAIVLAQIQFLRRLEPRLALTITSRTASLDRPFFESRKVAVVSPVLPGFSLYSSPGEKIRQGFRQGLDIAAKLRLAAEIRASDFVISSGGGCFYSNRKFVPGPTFFQNIVHVRLAQALSKPVIFFPESFGPLRSRPARGAVRAILRHPKTKKIFVRERLSWDALLSLGDRTLREKIEMCPDMAFLLRPEEGTVASAPSLAAFPKPRMIMTLRQWDFPEAATAADKIACRKRYVDAFRGLALAAVRRWKGSVLIVPHTRGPGAFEDDSIISRRFWEELRPCLPAARTAYLALPENASPADMMELYGQADIVLATRTHSAIFALLRGVPAVSVYYQPKGLGIMEPLGLADACLPIAELTAERLMDAAARILDRASGIPASVGDKIAVLRARAEEVLRREFNFLVDRR